MKTIAPSIMCADPLKLANELDDLKHAGVKLLHCDVMDGIFVQNDAMGLYVLEAIQAYSPMHLDIHLATIEPDKYIDLFQTAKPEFISFHLETSPYPEKTIHHIRSLGIKPSIAVHPDTRIEAIYPYLDMIDMVLLMTVKPGFAGQKFHYHVLEKLSKLHKELSTRSHKPLIEVDGNIQSETIEQILTHGSADVYVVGTAALFNQNPGSYLQKLTPLRNQIGENNSLPSQLVE